MKKAKIMLMTIAVAAVTGGLLAFKASTHFERTNICWATYITFLGCDPNVQIFFFSTVDGALPAEATICYTITDQTEATECPPLNCYGNILF